MWPDSDQTQRLIDEARQGVGQAVDRLLERHRDALRQLVHRRLDRKLQRRVDVSDVVQEVLVEANRRLANYLRHPPMPFHLWLRQIASDRIIDAHRRHRRSAKRSLDREQPLHAPGRPDRSTMELAVQLSDGQLTPAAAAVRRELAEQVEAALLRLQEPDHEVIVMRHYEHLSNQEVAQVLGLSEPAASMRYLRAIRRLRALLADDSTPPRSRDEPDVSPP